MKNEIIYTEQYALIVSELTSPPMKGQTFLTKENIIHTQIGYNYGDRVIIAHRPLTDAPIIEVVPLLPEFGDEYDIVDNLVMDYITEEVRPYVDKNPNQHYRIGIYGGSDFGFRKGYNKAKETYIEILKSIESLCDNQNPTHEAIWRLCHSLQQPKRPKYFEYETIYQVKSGTIQEHKDGLAGFEYYGPKIITNSQDQTELVGKYIF